MKDMREELEAIVPGIAVEEYYDAWRLLVILWRGLWYGSRMNWRKYARRIWSIFSDRVRAAARMGRGLNGFLAQVARMLMMDNVGGNAEERAEVARLLALPEEEQRRIVRQLRDETPILIMLLRLYRDKRKEKFEAPIKVEDEIEFS